MKNLDFYIKVDVVATKELSDLGLWLMDGNLFSDFFSVIDGLKNAADTFGCVIFFVCLMKSVLAQF